MAVDTSQFVPGKLYPDLLDQDEIWWTRDGRMMTLEEMESSHRRNLYWYLIRRRERFLFDEKMWLIAHEPYDPSDGVYFAFRSMWRPIHDADESPVASARWLAEKPLLKKLAELEGIVEHTVERPEPVFDKDWNFISYGPPRMKDVDAYFARLREQDAAEAACKAEEDAEGEEEDWRAVADSCGACGGYHDGYYDCSLDRYDDDN